TGTRIREGTTMLKAARCSCAALAGVFLTGLARGDDSGDATRRIAQLENRIAVLEAKEAGDAKEIAAAVDALLRDADHRSQLLQLSGETSAGYDEEGFFIRSGDAWLLRPGFLFQFRYSADFRQNTAGAKSDEIESG